MKAERDWWFIALLQVLARLSLASIGLAPPQPQGPRSLGEPMALRRASKAAGDGLGTGEQSGAPEASGVLSRLAAARDETVAPLARKRPAAGRDLQIR
jgi:hypothetical protein